MYKSSLSNSIKRVITEWPAEEILNIFCNFFCSMLLDNTSLWRCLFEGQKNIHGLTMRLTGFSGQEAALKRVLCLKI